MLLTRKTFRDILRDKRKNVQVHIPQWFTVDNIPNHGLITIATVSSGLKSQKKK